MAHHGSRHEYLAELVGTFILVFIGTATVVTTQVTAGPQSLGILNHLAIGLAFGVALMVAAYTVGPISGAHLNPAVTIGLAIDNRISKERVIPYIAAQCLGALLASLTLRLLLGTYTYGLGETTVGAWGLREALGVEASLTALLVFTVLGVTDRNASPGFAGLVIGGYLAISHLIGIPFSGNSLNPARSFGPAVLLGGDAIRQLLPVYTAAPIVGAVVGAFGYRLVKTGGKWS